MSSPSPFLLPQPLGIADIPVLSVWICLFWAFHVNRIIKYAFCVQLLSCNVLRLIYIVARISVFSFSWTIFHCMDLPHFVDPFISRWTQHFIRMIFRAFPLTLGFLGLSHGRRNVDLSLATVLMANASSSIRCSLMLACYAGHLDVVKHLRRHGASWETRDLGGCTALHWAADGGHCNVIEWMIKDGCEVWDLPCQLHLCP